MLVRNVSVKLIVKGEPNLAIVKANHPCVKATWKPTTSLYSKLQPKDVIATQTLIYVLTLLWYMKTSHSVSSFGSVFMYLFIPLYTPHMLLVGKIDE